MLTIRGYSDDVVEANIEKSRKCETCGQPVKDASQGMVSHDVEGEFGAHNESIAFTIGDDEGGVVVEMIYIGIWATKIHQLGEDIPVPWQVTIGADGHTVVVRVDCPEGTPARWMKRDRS